MKNIQIEKYLEPDVVVYVCILSYLGGGGRRMVSLRTAGQR
jgi:hypothetical protein